MLMYQLMSSRNSVPDRFYRAVYSVLLSDGPSTSSKAPMFLSLVFKVGGGPGCPSSAPGCPCRCCVERCSSTSVQRYSGASCALLDAWALWNPA